MQKVLPKSGAFTFERFGRTYHLKIDGIDDLKHVMELDEAHWVATTAPINTINTDLMFLDLLDDDDDGRVRASELKRGIAWTLANLKDHSGIKTGNLSLLLDAINTETSDGERIYESAKEVLEYIGKPDDKKVTLTQVRRLRIKEKMGGLDKEGIVMIEAAEDGKIEAFIKDILDTVGGEMHPSGKRGVNDDHLKKFMEESKAYSEWVAKGELSEAAPTTAIMPLGDATPAAYRIYSQLYPKLNQFFALCDLMVLEPGISEQIKSERKEMTAVNMMDTEKIETFLAEAPLMPPNKEGLLNLERLINPHYDDLMEDFQAHVIVPLIGEDVKTLTEDHWYKIKKTFSAHQKWHYAKPKTAVEKIPVERLRNYLAEAEYVDTVEYFMEESHQTAAALGYLQMVEKLILCQAYLLPFANSFVSFPNLYNPEARALFEMGTLIMDGRHFTMAVKVPDRKQHVKISAASNMFVLYVEISSKEGGKLYEIAVPVTSGNRGNLHAEKWGIFQDIEGQERHAKIVQIVENPISLREAIAAPFVRLGRAISTKLEDVTNKAEEKLEAKGSEVVTKVKDGVPAEPAKKGGDGAGGALAGGGIAIAALGSSLAFITKTLASMTWLKIATGLFAALMAVILPATIVAYLKLSKRDLSAILEGSGWGINTRMRLTRKQAHTFTFHPYYPFGSKGIIHRRSWWVLLFVLLLIAAGVYWLGHYYFQLF